MTLLTPYWSLDILIVSSSLMIAAYLFMTRKFKYWSRKGVMEITPTPFFGNFANCVLLKKSPSEFIRELYEQSEGLPFMGFYIFDKPFLLIRDPELVKQILVKDFNIFANKHISADSKNDRIGYSNLFVIKNPAWKYLRGKLTPIFTSGKLKKMFELMLIIGKNLEKHLESLNLDGNGKEIEVKDLSANFTTDLIASTAFGVDLNSLKDPNADFRVYGRLIFDYNIKRAFDFILIFFLPTLTKYFSVKFFGKATNALRNTFWRMINQRIESNVKRNDLIDCLIEMREKHKNQESFEGFKFDGDDLVSQAAVFFTGGFETSSTTISFTLYELALNQDVQKTLRTEIHDALAQTDGKITYDMIMNLPYLDMVISETLRKYPPLGFLDRVALQDYKIANSDVTIEKDTPIFIPMIGFHYDPKYFPNPEKYDPLRFSENIKKSRPNFVYMPFGEGPHICIGMRLGLLQSKLGIIEILKNYEILPCEKTRIPMVLNPKALTTTALGGLYLNIRKITTAAG
ncbi:cytochrome P450 6k1-like [Apis dorsata]|uniref:cytochrome P450 6k1-like n=1 Tax=Apis dorsata TaxID=7462 RepID=UPI0003DF5181|nr:cytochrome P450 6k1-like [Apis dorsata]XP_006610856.1 cytochrome P450 6k1-like [Apis dorsata]XP_006610857.1 cytochrome P450 6k1-like [Apis dorsata]XP_031364083.1 cytochrome P450 6k1-like [Apis dorsata]